MPKSKSLKCPKCDRTFALAIHLGRHMSATHGTASKQKPIPAKRRAGRSPAKSASQPRDTARLVAFIRAWRDEAAAERANIDARLAAIDAFLAV